MLNLLLPLLSLQDEAPYLVAGDKHGGEGGPARARAAAAAGDPPFLPELQLHFAGALAMAAALACMTLATPSLKPSQSV